jgi:hypothetical protein
VCIIFWYNCFETLFTVCSDHRFTGLCLASSDATDSHHMQYILMSRFPSTE